MHQHPRAARQGLGDVPGREGVPAPGRVPLPAPGGGLPRAAGRRRRPHPGLPRLRQHRPDAGRVPAARRRAAAEHRPPPRQHPLRRPSTWSTPRPRARPRSCSRSPSGSAPRSRRRSPRRSTSGWSPTPACSCTRTPAPASHRMAAELIEAGVDVNDIYRRLYERVPIEKLRLIARALEKIERFDDGRLAVTYIGAEDYAATGAGEVLTEGIIDFVRGARGHRGRGDGPRQDRRRPLGAQGQPALDRRRRRRLGDRPRAGRRRPPARGRLRQRPALRRAGRVPARRGRRASSG